MVKFKNKANGVVWEVTDTALIKRLESDDNFEEVKPVKKKHETAD